MAEPSASCAPSIIEAAAAYGPQRLHTGSSGARVSASAASFTARTYTSSPIDPCESSLKELEEAATGEDLARSLNQRMTLRLAHEARDAKPSRHRNARAAGAPDTRESRLP